MKLEDFDYELPPGAIAQVPAEPRDDARLMVPGASPDRDHRVRDLPAMVRAGDLVVLNDTRVLPARLFGTKSTGGRVEVLLLEPIGGDPRGASWWAMLRASRTPSSGAGIRVAADLTVQVEDRDGDRFRVRLDAPDGRVWDAVARHGVMPLPPYIRREIDDPRTDLDRDRYQTVYAERAGAVAAPTAGLHITEALLRRLTGSGVEVARLTLHVGAGTFRPVRSERIEDHVMHEEWFEIPPATAAAVERARAGRGRVVAVGTTVVRALETACGPDGDVRPGASRTSLFVTPGFRFRVVDRLLTNFHLPRSTLLMLVSAFAGRERVLRLYREALARGFRFYSYGDAMLLDREPAS